MSVLEGSTGLVKLAVVAVPYVLPLLVESVAIGATLLTASVNVLVVIPPLPSLAVIVTFWLWLGPSVVPRDQLQVPAALVPDFVTVPNATKLVHKSFGVNALEHLEAREG